MLLPASAIGKGHGREPGHTHSGAGEWEVLNSLGRHALLQRQLQGRAGLFGRSQAAAADVGDVAVIDDDGSILVRANPFDLSNRSVRYTPAQGGYRAAAGGDIMDRGVAASGTRLSLDDDDSRQLQIGFSFPYFGRTHTSVFVNSDGNLTFGSGDTDISERDLARFLTGAPRIAAFFTDLDPTVGGQITYAAEAGRFVVSWTEVPEWSRRPPGGPATFQVVLFPDGRIDFAYGVASPTFVENPSVVIGISPGSYTDTARLVDLSAIDGSETIDRPIAELFSNLPFFSDAAAAQRFYLTHEDSYDFLVFWTNFNPNLPPGAFAYEITVANRVTGLGFSSNFDFSQQFGSPGRMSSFLMMGEVSRYPSDPKAILPLLGENSTLSVLGQESGHRWLARFRYPDDGDSASRILLGRDNAHWSFFFNSEASVVEGNEIRDNGDGSFVTTDTVRRYGSLDQYAMGVRAPEEVPASFVVKNPNLLNPGRSPQTGVTFTGTRLNVTIDKVIEANGRRLPAAAVAPKDFRFAFILLAGRNTPATPEQIQQVDRIRQEWEQFWSQATGGRSRADTRLLRAVSFTGLPAATVPGAQVTARLRAATTSSSARVFALASSAPGVVSVPASVTLAAGAREVEVRITATAGGAARISASAEGHETAEGAVVVGSASTLRLAAISGDGQVGAPSATLPQPLVVEASDPANALLVPGATIRFSATGATVTPATATTDATGRAQAIVTLGTATGAVTITASVSGLDSVRATFTVTALAAPAVPAGSAVNGASFARAPAPVSPGSIISIFGTSLAAQRVGAAALPLPATLGTVTARINGIAAPLFLVSPTQLNVQVPVEITGTTATLTVTNGSGTSAPITVAIAPAAPGIFTTLQNGTGPGAVLHGDGVLVSTTAPARAGEIISVFCTGLGAVAPQVASGQGAPTSPPATTLGTPQVTIGGQPAEVLFSGLAPGFVGLYQLNVRVPAVAANSSHPLVITLGSASNTATLAVQ